MVPITLVPSSTNAQVLLVTNATNPALSFGWNSSPYGSDTISYALQYDTVGGKFANPQVIKYGNAFASAFSVNDLNTAAIAAGVIGGSTKNVEFRVVSYIGTSYTQQVAVSNVVTISINTYTPIPANLFIVGDATAGAWNNPVPVPSQQLTKLDPVTYGIVLNLTAGGSYLLLPNNLGKWESKYAIVDATVPGASAGGSFGFYSNANPTAFNSNIPAPATSGMYQIVVNFQTGKYTVTPFTQIIPTALFIVGDATPGAWNNPVPVPSQQFTQIDAVTFGMVINLTAGGSYLLLPNNLGKWESKFAVTDNTVPGLSAGGTIGYYSSANPTAYNSNIPAPATSGLYQIIVNFEKSTFTVTPYTGVVPVPTNLFIVGDATPGAWGNPVPVPSQQFTRVSLTEFQLTLPLTAGGSYLLLPNNLGQWEAKYAVVDNTIAGLSAGGAFGYYSNANPTSYNSNIPAPGVSGNYLIDVNFATGKFTTTKQ